MIDTHTHLYLPEFPDGGDEQVRNAIDAGVTHLVFPNVDRDTISPMLALHNRFPENTSVAMGLHPTEVKDNWKVVVDDMQKLLVEGGFVAVGEVGMDLYWDKTYRAEQMLAFAEQLCIAESMSLPVIIHCREALDETLDVIKSVRPTVRLIFHSFTGTPDEVRKIRKLCDPMFGINGVVTFKNAGSIRDSLSIIGIDRILLETDSPYLAPVPNRGKRNDSSNMPYICAKVAETLGMTVEEIDSATSANARNTFCL